MDRIGLIAGDGKLPLIFCRKARERGSSVVAVGVTKETSPELEGCVAKVHWLQLDQLGRLFKIFVDEGVANVAMAGRIKLGYLFKEGIRPDRDFREILEGAEDRRGGSLLSAVAEKLRKLKINLIDLTEYLSELLPPEGTMTKGEPSQGQWEDIKFGRMVAKNVASLDIGQTVVVKDKAILAVEAIEGTDEAIRRGGSLGGGQVVVVKVASPQQDMRFDVPVVGPETIRALVQARTTCLAIELGKTFLIDKDEVIRLADEAGISIVVV